MIRGAPQDESIPLAADDAGTIRIAGTRVTLDVVSAAWRSGATPESIVESFPTLALDDVYAVITWMLRHADELERYLIRRSAEATQIREQIEASGSTELRQRLRSS